MENARLLGSVALRTVEEAVQKGEIKGSKRKIVEDILLKHNNAERPLLHPDNMELQKLLGEGGFAMCISALHTPSSIQVAVKRCTNVKLAQSEKSIMLKLNHPSIIKLLGSFMLADTSFLTTELASEGTVHHQMQIMTEKDVSKMALQMISALQELNRRQIIHRDIKPQNVLISNQTYKLCDFNLALQFDRLPHNDGKIHGTAGYYAPESLTKQDYSPHSDLFSLGLVVLEAQTNSPLFPYGSRILATEELNDYAIALTQSRLSHGMRAVLGTALEEILVILLDFEQNCRSKYEAAIKKLKKSLGSKNIYDDTVVHLYPSPTRANAPVDFFTSCYISGASTNTRTKHVVFWEEFLNLDFYHIHEDLIPKPKADISVFELALMQQDINAKDARIQQLEVELKAAKSLKEQNMVQAEPSDEPNPLASDDDSHALTGSTNGISVNGKKYDHKAPNKVLEKRKAPKIVERNIKKPKTSVLAPIITSTSADSEPKHMPKKAWTRKKAPKISSSSSESDHSPYRKPSRRLRKRTSAKRANLNDPRYRNQFQCEMCRGRFASQHNLERHQVNVHGEGQTFECEEPGCDKVFRRKEYLNDHVNRTHKKIKSYKCSICGNKFHTRAEVHIHTKKRHPAKYIEHK